MGAPSKRAKPKREAEEFNLSKLQGTLTMPRGGGIPLTSWTLADIFAARDAQLRGDFNRAAKMAEAMRTDEALAVPFKSRLSPQQSVQVRLKPAKNGNPKALSICNEADGQFGANGVALHHDTLASIHECLTNHEVAFAKVTPIPREDGTRTDYEVNYWPIEHVRWDPLERVYKTRVDPTSNAERANEVVITHGDGRWVIFQRYENEPFKHAALLAASLIWARHAYALRDWAKGSVSHGNAKVVATLPKTVALQDENGNLTPEAQAMATLLRALSSADAPIGIMPAESKVEYITNNSGAWQVFANLVSTAERSAARLYLGTDATLGSPGNAPGMNIEALFGVARTYVQSDLACISRGLQTGVIEPWTAINFGDSTLAPTREYILPDEDEDAARAALAAKKDRFYVEIKLAREQGFVVDQAFVDRTAKDCGLEEAPRLPEEAQKAPSIALAPTDIARVVTVNEARASAGVGPLMNSVTGAADPDGNMTVEQFALKKAAEVAPKPAPPAQNAVTLSAAAQPGPPGPPGPQGPQGPPGRDGKDGAPGPSGPPGRDGSDGATGPQGPAGRDGAPGRDGADGRNGVDGAPGRDGVDGAPGRDGADGSSAPKTLTFAERNAAFLADLKDHQELGLCIDETQIVALAKLHGVPAPRLANGA